MTEGGKQVCASGSAVAAGYIGETVYWTGPTNQTLTTSEADWTNSGLTLTAGIWLVTANINTLYQTATTAGANGATIVKITDSSNNTVQNMVKTVYSAYGNGTQAVSVECNLGFSFVANVTSSTLYKIRAYKNDAAGTGVGAVYNSSNERSHFYAIRIA